MAASPMGVPVADVGWASLPLLGAAVGLYTLTLRAESVAYM